jgi:hypothetical protein
MQIGPIPLFLYGDVPAAQNRFRWKSKKSAGNLKNPLENKISSRKSKFPAEPEIFCRKFKNSAGKLKNLLCRRRFNNGPFWRRSKDHFDEAILDRIPTLRAGVKAKPCRSLHEP